MGSEDVICIGDTVALYSDDVLGYVFAMQSSSAHAYLAVNSKEDRAQPRCPDAQVLSFRICAANRYKLQKTYRKLAAACHDSTDVTMMAPLKQAKIAAEAEGEDNAVEQKRQKGKKLLYGQVVQLQHVFTGKFVHISTQNTSPTESTNMQVTLDADNAAFALFRVMPRFKVKGEGDLVQAEDQVILESVKSPGQYLHVSRHKFESHMPVYSDAYELNLSVRFSGFTLTRRFRETEDDANKIRAGQPIRFFHTELEAYLVCEGTFNEPEVEDVHLRVRAMDQTKPATMFPPTSAICYWQLEFFEGCVSGEVIKWEQQVRIRHMCTRKFLVITKEWKLALTDDRTDARAVFRLHPVLRERDEIETATFCRIEHVVTGAWLHGSKEDYTRKTQRDDAEFDNSMTGLVWSQAPLKKVEIVQEMQFDDAFTIYLVDPELVGIFNYAAGCVPFVQKLCAERRQATPVPLNAYRCHLVTTAFAELREFMVVNSEPNKRRQKLLRNLRIVELVVRLLQTPFRGGPDQAYVVKIFIECYEVLYTYLNGNSRKNELYIAKHIDFFRTQVVLEEDVGLNAAHMIMELIKDNRKIVDRIPHSYVDEIIDLLKQNKNFRYLELLSVLCVCDGMSMPENQNYITEKWLVEGQQYNLVFYTELGQTVGKERDKVFVSVDRKRHWTSLVQFARDYQKAKAELKLNSDGSVNVSHLKSHRRQLNKRRLSPEEQNTTIIEEFLFLQHQLDLLGKLCQGRNAKSIEVITKQLNYLNWEEAFLCLTDEDLPDQLRAKYCELITTMFIDVDDNISVLDKIDLTFVYDQMSKHSQSSVNESGASKNASTQRHFPPLRDWLATFLDQNHDMTASDVGHNILIARVMQMLHFLVKFGYYNSSNDIKKLMRPLLELLDGRNDKPIPRTSTPEFEKVLQHYQSHERYRQSREAKAVVDAKYQAMRVLDLFFNFRFNVRLKRFVAEFKDVQFLTQNTMSNTADPLAALLSESYELNEVIDADARQRLEDMFGESSFFKDFDIVNVFMDLSNYEYPKMVQMSMWLLNRFYSAHNLLFKRAVLAQVLITDRSVAVYRMVEDETPVMRRLIGSKMTDVDVEKMCSILTKFSIVCHLDNEPEERHPMNQNILYNNGILNDIFDLVSQDVDINLLDEYSGLRRVFNKCFNLLRMMARGNQVVQNHLFDRLDALLNCIGAESELALALAEVFTGNKSTCMKVLPHHIARTMALAAQHGVNAPEFLDMLNALVKIEELDLPLKRNQAYVMKYFMQHRNDVAQCLDQGKEAQLQLLRSAARSPDSDYMIALVDLLATCAEGENRFIESINQTIYRVSDVLSILTDPAISNRNKRPYARFLLWVYLNTAGGLIESGAGDLPHDSSMWKFFAMVREDLRRMAELAVESPQLVRQLLKIRVMKREMDNPMSKEKLEITDEVAHGTLKYLFEGALPVVNTFFKSIFIKDHEDHGEEIEEINNLAKHLVNFVEAILPLISDEKYVKYLLSCATSLLTVCTLPAKDRQISGFKAIEEFQGKYGGGIQINWDVRSEAKKQYEMYYSAEEELNVQLNIFATNFSIAYGGENSVRNQIGFSCDEEYTVIGSDEELPLGKEFQDHVSCFVDPNLVVSDPDKFKLAGKLVEQLFISNQVELNNEKERIEQEILDVKCLQLLRAIVHNEIVKVPNESDSFNFKE